MRVIGDRWGVSDAEVARPYPCDEFVTVSAIQVWRGVTVDAPIESLWPWVAQVRIAPYSYDWIDNLGRRSPNTLVGLPEPVVGEPFTTAAGRKVGRIVSVTPGAQLTGKIIGAYMSYILVPAGTGSTRLILKAAIDTSRWVAPVLSLGDLVMA